MQKQYYFEIRAGNGSVQWFSSFFYGHIAEIAAILHKIAESHGAVLQRISEEGEKYKRKCMTPEDEEWMDNNKK